MTDEQRAAKQQRALDEIRATFNCLTKAYFQRTLKPVFAKRVDPIAPITPATIEKLDALAEWLRMQAGCQKPMFPASVEMLYVLWAIVAHCKRSNVKRPVAKFVAILARRDLQVALKTMPDTQQQTGFYVDSIKATEFVEPEAPTTDGAKRDEHSGDTSN